MVQKRAFWLRTPRPSKRHSPGLWMRRHPPPSLVNRQTDAGAWVCTSLQSPDAHLQPLCKFFIINNGNCKDFFFFHIAINISPICYEFSRLWKAGFGNAFPILNRPRRDKLLEYNHLNRGDYLHVFCGVRLALASMILQVTEWGGGSQNTCVTCMGIVGMYLESTWV